MSGAPGPTGNQRGAATRRRILEAAEACFEEHGVDLTLDEVARAAGTTRMTVHRHTGGREQLVTHLVLRASARLAERLRAGLDGPGPFDQRLADALVTTVVVIRETPALARLFAGNPTGTWPTLDPGDRVPGAIRTFFAPYLRAAADDGLLRADADLTLDWLLRQVLVLLLLPGSAPDEAAVRHQVETFVLPGVLRAGARQRREAATR